MRDYLRNRLTARSASLLDDAAGVSSPVLIFQQAFVQLACWVSREFVSKVDGPRTLDVGEVFSAVG